MHYFIKFQLNINQIYNIKYFIKKIFSIFFHLIHHFLIFYFIYLRKNNLISFNTCS
jgi:hypothetical protein